MLPRARRRCISLGTHKPRWHRGMVMCSSKCSCALRFLWLAARRPPAHASTATVRPPPADLLAACPAIVRRPPDRPPPARQPRRLRASLHTSLDRRRRPTRRPLANRPRRVQVGYRSPGPKTAKAAKLKLMPDDQPRGKHEAETDARAARDFGGRTKIRPSSDLLTTPESAHHRTRVGARETDLRPNLCLERPCSGEVAHDPRWYLSGAQTPGAAPCPHLRYGDRLADARAPCNAFFRATVSQTHAARRGRARQGPRCFSSTGAPTRRSRTWRGSAALAPRSRRRPRRRAPTFAAK